MSWNDYVNSNSHPTGMLNSVINSGPSGNSSSSPSPADLYRRQQYLNSVPGGITPGSILDKNLYENAGWHGEPRPFPEKKYEEDPGGYIRTTKGEKEYQNDLKKYEKSVIRKFKNDHVGGRRKSRKSRKSRKTRNSKRTRRR